MSKQYNFNNITTDLSPFYIGKEKDYLDFNEQGESKNIYLFASLLPSKNIKIIGSNNIDLSVYVDSRWYEIKNISSEPILFSHLDNTNKKDIYFRTITTNGSMYIKPYTDSNLLWNGINYIKSNIINQESLNCTDSTIKILQPDYIFDNVEIPFKYTLSHNITIDKSIHEAIKNIKLNLKSIKGSDCIKITNKNDSLRIDFDDENCPCGIVQNNIINSSESSINTSDSQSSSSDESLYYDISPVNKTIPSSVIQNSNCLCDDPAEIKNPLTISKCVLCKDIQVLLPIETKCIGESFVFELINNGSNNIVWDINIYSLGNNIHETGITSLIYTYIPTHQGKHQYFIKVFDKNNCEDYCNLQGEFSINYCDDFSSNSSSSSSSSSNSSSSSSSNSSSSSSSNSSSSDSSNSSSSSSNSSSSNSSNSSSSDSSVSSESSESSPGESETFIYNGSTEPDDSQFLFFTLNRIGGASSVMTAVIIGGTAVNGVDYNAPTYPLIGTLNYNGSYSGVLGGVSLINTLGNVGNRTIIAEVYIDSVSTGVTAMSTITDGAYLVNECLAPSYIYPDEITEYTYPDSFAGAYNSSDFITTNLYDFLNNISDLVFPTIYHGEIGLGGGPSSTYGGVPNNFDTQVTLNGGTTIGWSVLFKFNNTAIQQMRQLIADDNSIDVSLLGDNEVFVTFNTGVNIGSQSNVTTIGGASVSMSGDDEGIIRSCVVGSSLAEGNNYDYTVTYQGLQGFTAECNGYTLNNSFGIENIDVDYVTHIYINGTLNEVTFVTSSFGDYWDLTSNTIDISTAISNYWINCSIIP